MMWLFSIFILTARADAPSTSTSTSPCKDVRLDEPGKAFATIPVYDQKQYSTSDPGICYAVVTSELADANRFAHGDNLAQLTSPLSLALNYKNNLSKVTPEDHKIDAITADNPGDVADGSVYRALKYGLDPSVCDQRWLERYASTITTQAQAVAAKDQPPSVLGFLGGAIDQIENYQQAQNALARGDTRLNGAPAVSPFFKCREAEGVANLNEILAATKAGLVASSPIPRAQLFLQSLCGDNSFRYTLPKPVNVDIFDEHKNPIPQNARAYKIS